MFDVIDEYGADYMRHVLCTDVARDGLLAGPNIELYGALAQRYPKLQVQASGGIRDVADIANARAAGCRAAVLGKALIEGRFALADALAEASPC